jgi:hypothetical protein
MGIQKHPLERGTGFLRTFRPCEGLQQERAEKARLLFVAKPGPHGAAMCSPEPHLG